MGKRVIRPLTQTIPGQPYPQQEKPYDPRPGKKVAGVIYASQARTDTERQRVKQHQKEVYWREYKCAMDAKEKQTWENDKNKNRKCVQTDEFSGKHPAVAVKETAT